MKMCLLIETPLSKRRQTNMKSNMPYGNHLICQNMLNFVYVECSSGYFGLGCNKRCIGHCINNKACDHVSGFCLQGCMDGYIGRHCNICKISTKFQK